MHELLLAFIVIFLLGWILQVDIPAERNGILRMLKESRVGSSWLTHGFSSCLLPITLRVR